MIPCSLFPFHLSVYNSIIPKIHIMITMSTGVTEETFIHITQLYFYLPSKQNTVFTRRLWGVYGVPSHIFVLLWNKLFQKLLISGYKPKHLLWTLNFLNAYSSEHVNCGMWKWGEKTDRKCTWTVIQKTAELKIVGINY